MKPEQIKICLALGLCMLAASLSSCSLVGKGKYASQWEVQTDVPDSLNSGQATAPTSGAYVGSRVKSNLDGQQAPMEDTMLDLPMNESGTIIDVPKPGAGRGAMASMSPPEMLNVPSSEGAGDLPMSSSHALNVGDSLLAALPPPVTEEELNLPSSALAMSEETPAPAADTAPVSTSAPEPSVTAPAAGEASAPAEIPSIPLLYGKFDLKPFLSPVPPLAANAAEGPGVE